MIVYISIGNSDDKLTQVEWSSFIIEMITRVVTLGNRHGEWFSTPFAAYQNACWCVEFDNPTDLDEAREVTAEIREKYRQDSIAWAIAETEFI